MYKRRHENSIVESMKFVKEMNESLAAKEEAAINEKLEKIEKWKINYFKTLDNRREKERFHGKLLEAARNDALGTAMKAIYITAVENHMGLTDDEAALAEAIVENWIRENGGATEILTPSVQKRSYLLARLAQITEEAAHRAVAEVEAIGEADDDEKEEKVEEKKEDKKEEVTDDGKEETTETEEEEEEVVEEEPEEGDFPDEDLDKDTDNDDDEEEEVEDHGDELDTDDEEEESIDYDETEEDEEESDEEESSDDDEEVSTSDDDEEASEEEMQDADEELLDDDPEEDNDDSDVDDTEEDHGDEIDSEESDDSTEEEESESEEEYEEEEDEEPDQIYKDLEDEKDVKKAIDTIQSRIADAEQKFVEKNAEDKKKVDEILHKIDNNLKTVEEISDKDNPKVQAAQERATLYRRKQIEMENIGPKSVFEAICQKVTEAAYKKHESNKVITEYTTEDVDISTEANVNRTVILYGFLETLNTLKFDVDERFIEEAINSIN